MGTFAEPKAAPRGKVQIASVVPSLGAQIRITPQARYYAVAELCRRAGVPRDFFRTWKASISADKTVFEISNGTQKYVTFPHVSPGHLVGLAAGRVESAHIPLARPLPGHGAAAGISHCIVPFVSCDESAARPLFYLSDANHLECSVDLPLAILLTLSRWEETLDFPRDHHGRFQSRNSISHAGRFLDRPIVDEYGLAFEQALESLYPSWRKPVRKARIKISHDADHVGIPFRWRTAARHAIRRRAVGHSFRDLLSAVSGVEPAELLAVREIILATQRHGLNSAVYWKAAPQSLNDSGYDPRHIKVRGVLRWLDQMGVESGVHPGYNTFRAPEKLRREVAVLREVLGERSLGGRQHYLRWSPETWLDWENCGLAYDSSVSFAEEVGFRAGTCFPYHPWLFALNRQADLTEIPLLVMDRTLLGYMNLSREQALQSVETILQRCYAVGGVFTTLWHPDAFLDPLYRDVYLDLLPVFSGMENYNWQPEGASSSNSR